MQGFAFTYAQEVAFRDLDALGHTNNAVYVSYLESARLAYMREVLGVEKLDELGVVADIKVGFRSPSFLGETLEVGVRVAHVGGKSLDFEYRIDGPDGRLVAEATSVHVAYDYAVRETVPVPDDWRSRIAAHEGSLAAV